MRFHIAFGLLASAIAFGGCLPTECATDDLECLLGGLVVREAGVEAGLVEARRSALPAPGVPSVAPQFTSQPEDMRFTKGADDQQPLVADWVDPNGCQPSFCFSVCGAGPKSTRLCSQTTRCTHTRRDGRTQGTWRSTLAYSVQPGSTTSVTLQVTPAATASCQDVAEAIANGGNGGNGGDGVTIVTGAGLEVGQSIVPPPPKTNYVQGMCSASMTCGGSCSFKACAGSNGAAWYDTSDGLRYPCGSNGDCQGAANAVVHHCCG